jgi:hypothetical protein
LSVFGMSNDGAVSERFGNGSVVFSPVPSFCGSALTEAERCRMPAARPKKPVATRLDLARARLRPLHGRRNSARRESPCTPAARLFGRRHPAGEGSRRRLPSDRQHGQPADAPNVGANHSKRRIPLGPDAGFPWIW